MPSIFQDVIFDDAGIRSLSQRQLKALAMNAEPRFFYDKSVKMARRISVHADGDYPLELIECRRPNEADEAKKYREKIWIEKTKPTFDRVMLFLNKIRRSSEWSIFFNNEDELTRIAAGERLSDYTEKYFPGFTSVTNWIFKVVLKKYLIDPNAVLFVRPMKEELAEGAHYRPIGTIFMSPDVIVYNSDYVVLRNPEGAFYYSQGRQHLGESFYLITDYAYYRFDQINARKDFALNDDETLIHDLGIIPAFQLQGVVKDQFNDQVLYESRIEGMIPELDEAVREYSDLQAAKVLHLYPERYEYTNTECTDCKGTGIRTVTNGDVRTKESCNTCEGHGYIVRGPYGKHIFKPAGMDEQQLPTPPIGYVTKDIEIIKVQDESVEAHIYSALAAVNLEMVARVPMTQSGTAKQYDADLSSNTLNAIAEDLVAIMDRFYFVTAKYRYSIQYPTDAEIEEMVPSIAVPERFDIATTGMLEAEVGSAKSNKLNPTFINQIELDYANKRFYNNPAIRERLDLVLSLDPLANISSEDKNSMLQNNGISKIDYVVSSNIVKFIAMAIEADKNFAQKKPDEQRKAIEAFAQAMIDAGSGIKLPDTDDDFEEFEDPTGEPAIPGENNFE